MKEPPVRRDPLFALFNLPATPEQVVLTKRYLRFGKGVILFSEAGERVGVFSSLYKPGETSLERPHTHGFLELILVISGAGWHVRGKSMDPVRGGEVLFINNRRPHHFRADGDDFEILTVSFLPSAAGFDDSILRRYDLVNYYTLLIPFHAIGAGQTLARLRPQPEAFKKLAFYCFHLCEMLGEGSPPVDLVRRNLVQALHLLQAAQPAQAKAATPLGLPLYGVLAWLEAHAHEEVSRERLAALSGMSPSYFSTQFKKIMGKGLARYVAELRIDRARALLSQTSLSIRAIASRVGFKNASHFTQSFRAITGAVPLAVRTNSIANRTKATSRN